jgi:hypothetical protein
MLKQIGMTAGAVKNYPAIFRINTVYEEPVWFNMALPFPLILPTQGVVLVFGEQGNLLYEHTHNIPKLIDVFMTFFHQLAISIKRTGYLIIEHNLQFQNLIQVFNRIMPLGRYLPPEHCITFFKGGDSLGIVARISSYWVTVRGADGTFAFIVKPVIVGGFGREGKNNWSLRYFMRNVNGQPVTGRYFYGLRNAHGINIA